MNNLPEDITRLILKYLELKNLYFKANSVCKSWKKITRNKEFILDYVKEHVFNYPDPTNREITIDEYECCFSMIQSMYEEHSSVLVTADGASSSESIIVHQALTISDHSKTFWCSTGTIEPSDEVLLYGVFSSCTMINGCEIKFYVASWMKRENEPICFGCESVRIEIINKEKVIFNQEFKVENHGESQFLRFDKPVFATSEYFINVHLIGSREKTADQGLYHIAVNKIRFFGASWSSLPYIFDGNKFKKLNKNEFSEIYRPVMIAKHQLKWLAEYIEEKRDRLPQPDVIENYLNLLSQFYQLNLVDVHYNLLVPNILSMNKSKP